MSPSFRTLCDLGIIVSFSILSSISLTIETGVKLVLGLRLRLWLRTIDLSVINLVIISNLRRNIYFIFEILIGEGLAF